jgi:hypothetical protein
VNAHVERVHDRERHEEGNATEGRVKISTGWRSTNRDHPVPT